MNSLLAASIENEKKKDVQYDLYIHPGSVIVAGLIDRMLICVKILCALASLLIRLALSFVVSSKCICKKKKGFLSVLLPRFKLNGQFLIFAFLEQTT